MAGDPALDAGLEPHKALYDMSLVASHGGSQVVNVSGQMFYDWQTSCDAWISNHRFNVLYEYADSTPMRITSDFSTFESFDQSVMNFTSQRKRNGMLYEEVRGHADLQDSGEGQAIYSIPPDLSYDLPKGAKFPMAHTLGLLKSIEEGKKFYSAIMFDGSDTDGPVEVNAFIGNEIEAPKRDAAGVETPFLQGRAWPVRLAFFPLNEPAEVPDYEMSVVFYENGVIRDMVIEYDDFTIAQKLVAIEPVSGSCEEQAGGK